MREIGSFFWKSMKLEYCVDYSTMFELTKKWIKSTTIWNPLRSQESQLKHKTVVSIGALLPIFLQPPFSFIQTLLFRDWVIHRDEHLYSAKSFPRKCVVLSRNLGLQMIVTCRQFMSPWLANRENMVIICAVSCLAFDGDSFAMTKKIVGCTRIWIIYWTVKVKGWSYFVSRIASFLEIIYVPIILSVTFFVFDFHK